MNTFMVDHKLILVISLYQNKKQTKVSVCVGGGELYHFVYKIRK